MRKTRGFHGLSGDGRLDERHFIGLIFYKRVRRQKWSPALHEIEVECGVRIGRFRLGLTSSKLHWITEKKIEYRRYSL
jgi:hypothetical protein